jgi:aryl-alcohol dehydrogenase-like predicted oxidoreductase
VGAARWRVPFGEVPARRRAAGGLAHRGGARDEFEEAWTRRDVERDWRTLEVVGEISEQTGRSYAQISLLRQQGVTAPIIGARRLERLEDHLGAAGWDLADEQVARLSEATAIQDVYPYRLIRETERV